jgi:Leucine-rich repeat (LRR) protein
MRISNIKNNNQMNSDAIYCILNHLQLRDVLACILINKQFNKVSKCELIWKRLSDEDCPGEIDKNYYENYTNHCKLTKLNKFLHKHYRAHTTDSLNLSVRQLSSLPSGIGLLTNLVSLRLPINNLKSLPSSIGSLTKLEILDVSWNELGSLPKEIELLTKLRYIEIQKNQIEDIPLSLSRLTKLPNLQTLVMDQSQISLVPIELSTKLRQIRHYLSMSPNIEKVDNLMK